MNTHVMSNVQDDMKCIVYTSDYIRRPVASMNRFGGTQQCVSNGDIVISTAIAANDDNRSIQVAKHGTDENLSSEEIIDIYNNCVTFEDDLFLNNDAKGIPVNSTWNGTDTIQSLACEYGIKNFLTGVNPEIILTGLLGLNTDISKPMSGAFDVDKLLQYRKVRIKKAATSKVTAVTSVLDADYSEWIISGKVGSVDIKPLDWRVAKTLPKLLSVSCIIKDGKPVRYNDLVVWRGEEVEVISIFDITATFKMNDTNFLSLPYLIDDEVTRIMYLLHDENLNDDVDNIAWLYRKR